MSNDLLTIVTGASSNHFGCLCNLLTSLDRHEDARVLVHDLGLTEPEAQRLRDDGRKLTTFPFDRYPPHFGQSATFALPYVWKPVIIHDVLMAAGHPVLWLDAGNLVHERRTGSASSFRTVGFYSRAVPAPSPTDPPVTLQGLAAGRRSSATATAPAAPSDSTNDLAQPSSPGDAALNKGDLLSEGGRARSTAATRPAVGAGGASPPAAAVHAHRSLFRHQRQNDEATPEQAARLMTMTAQEVRQEKGWRRAQASLLTARTTQSEEEDGKSGATWDSGTSSRSGCGALPRRPALCSWWRAIGTASTPGAPSAK
jgi:hypothetical protein